MTKFANWTRAELHDAEREIERNISYLECDLEEAKARYHESCGNDAEAEEKIAATEEQLKFAKEELAEVEERLECGDNNAPEENVTTEEENKMKQAQVTITAANSAAAKEMIQEIAKATGANFESYEIKPFGIMVGGKGKNRVDHYSSTDGKISYSEAYEKGELEHVNFFNEDDDFVATIQVADGGAEKAEICKTLGIEQPASKAAIIDAGHQRTLDTYAAQIEQQKEQIAAREEKIAAAEAEIEANEAEIARLIAQNETETDKLEKLSTEREIACLRATNEYRRHDIKEYREAIKGYEGTIAMFEADKAKYLSWYEGWRKEQIPAEEPATASEPAAATTAIEQSNDGADEPAAEVELVVQAEPEIEEIEVINPAVFDHNPNDKLLKIRGCIFTHSQYTFVEACDYLEKIEACDAGADQVFVTDDEALIENFSDDYTPEEYAVGFRGRLLTSTLNLIKAKVKSFDNPDGTYTPHFAVLRYDAEPVEDDDDEDSEPPKQELPNDNGDFPCYDEPEPPTEPAEEIPVHIADKIAYCNKLLTAQTCRPKYFLGAMEDLQAMLDGNPAAIDAYNALVERYNEVVHNKGGDFLDCLSPIRADLDETAAAAPACDTSDLPNYDEPKPATDSNTEQEETALENEDISTILHQVQRAEDVAKNTIREFFKVADSYSGNTPEDNDMAALYRMFAGEVYKIWREINKVRKTTGALLKNTATATQAPDEAPPLCTTTAIPFTGLLSEQTWLYMSQSTFENYLAGKKWHAHIPEITAKDATAALKILRQITTTEYRVTHTYHGEYGERQEYCKGDNGVDILKWYSPTYRNHPEHSDELMSIVFFRSDTPVAQIHVPARWLNDKLVFEGDREGLTAEQIAEVQEFLGLPPQEQVTETPTLKISEAPAGESTTFKISQNPRDDEPANNSIDSETPATETTVLIPPLDGTALTKDLADTVLEVKIAADEIEEMLAGGYDLSDSGCNSISKAQELLKQAIAELGKLKSIDSAA